MNDGVLAINSSIGCEASKNVQGLENKVRASMKAVISGNWMETKDEALFRAGIGGALLDIGVDSDDGKKLLNSVEALKQLSAFITASQAGLSVSPPDVPEDILPLMGWWHEVKGKK